MNKDNNFEIVVIGGGWAGVSAAVRAKKAGVGVLLIERTDLLLGLGNVGGIMRNNGRFTATEENIAMGNYEMFEITDRNSTHKNVDFPGHKHASFYDVIKVEPDVRRLLKRRGVKVLYNSRVVDVEMDGAAIAKLTLADGTQIEGKVFIDATGTTGPMGNCTLNGNGCSMCVLRCPSFGPRVSISAKAGADDMKAIGKNGRFGAFSGSCKLEKSSLGESIQKDLKRKGLCIIPLPDKLIKKEKLDLKVCKQYALDKFAENVILIDTGYAKMMTPFFGLEELRQIPGFENARYIDPYAGGKGNSIRYMAVAPRDEFLRVKKVDNLFCAGEKAGFFVGHTEAISTGSLAGFNAGRMVKGKELLSLPENTAVGLLIAEGNRLVEEGGFERRLTFAGGEFFEKMVDKGLYTTNKKAIAKNIEDLGLRDIYKEA